MGDDRFGPADGQHKHKAFQAACPAPSLRTLRESPTRWMQEPSGPPSFLPNQQHVASSAMVHVIFAWHEMQAHGLIFFLKSCEVRVLQCIQLIISLGTHTSVTNASMQHLGLDTVICLPGNST